MRGERPEVCVRGGGGLAYGSGTPRSREAYEVLQRHWPEAYEELLRIKPDTTTDSGVKAAADAAKLHHQQCAADGEDARDAAKQRMPWRECSPDK